MQLTCTQKIDTANNKSIITWVLSSVGGDNNYYSTGPTAIYINGTNVYYKDRVNWDAKVFPAAKGSVSNTIEVAHNENGSKSIAVGMQTVIYNGAGSSKVYQDTWELDTIERGARFTDYPTHFYNTDRPTIKYTNPLGDKATKVEVCIADSVGYYAYAPYRDLSKTGTSYTFTAEDIVTLNNKMAKDGTELKVMFVIKTTTADGKVYSDGKTSTFHMLEVDDTLPSVSLSLTAINPSSVASSLSGLYIQGKTRVNATITANGKYNATISKYGYRIPGKYEWSTSNIFTTDAITSAGNVEFYGKAEDTRGFQREVSQTISVLEYSKPLVIPLGNENAILCYRSDGNGVRVGNSTSVWIKAKRSYYPLGGKNGCALQWRRKLSSEAWGSQSWSTLISSTTTNTEEYNKLVSGTFELNKSYSVQIRAIDDVGESDTKEFEIPTQDVALHLGKGGKNVSIGEYCDYSEDYTFRSAWKAKFDNGICVKGNVEGTLSNTVASDVLTFADSCPNGITPFITGGGTTNVPDTGNYQYSSGCVFKRGTGMISVLLISYYSGDLAINTYYDTAGGWLGWRYLHTTTT